MINYNKKRIEKSNAFFNCMDYNCLILILKHLYPIKVYISMDGVGLKL